jgi:hypothetical protein
MDEGFMFVLGILLGSLTMLFVMIRIIVGMHDGMDHDRWKR